MVKNAPRFAEKDFTLECVQGENAEGKSVFAYVLVQKKKLDALRKALGTGEADLAKFGLIVAAGEGPKPGKEFEDQLIESLKKEQKV